VRPALFLDRDGVINVDHGYVHRVEHFEFVDGVFELARAAAVRAMPVVVVTNQAGIGRGYYAEDDFLRLTDWMRDRFAERDAPIAAVYHCPYHPEHGLGDWRRDSFDRKPNPGMLLQARDALGLDLARSVMLGDTDGDMLAAQRAGVLTRCLLVHGAAPAQGAHTHAVTRLADAIALLDAPR